MKTVEAGFRSPLHEARTAALLGAALGLSFTICFATGILSHLIQNPPSWFLWPSRPAGLYRITQGLHVATGLAAVPLLLAKLWVVYPHLWTRPRVRNVAHAVERLSLLPLVAGSLFMLMSGIANVARWYPWEFFFPSAHHRVAWITMGGLIAHIGAKLATTREALRRVPAADLAPADPTSRRAFVGGVAATSGLLTLATAGGTVGFLSPVSALAQRRPATGPQGVPVNKTAASAGVEDAARSSAYRLAVSGAVTTPLSLSLEDLRRLPQREATLPISCVEGWSQSARWRGVAVRDLLKMAGASEDATVAVESLQRRGLYRRSTLNRLHAQDRDTLLALELNGEPLDLDHGFPVRLIGPNRPGVLQTKWVAELVVG